MIAEFVGCTGAGKTTLITEVQRRLAKRTEVRGSFDLVGSRLGLSGVSQPTVRNLIQEFAGLPFLFHSLPHHKAFILFTLRMLARQANVSIFTVNNFRSLVRKLGMYEINRRGNRDHIVLVDEGTVLIAHNVFVYSSANYTPGEIEEFARLVPLPDAIVYVRAPLDTLVERTLQRSDPPRELKSKNRELVEKSVSRAIAIFDQLVQTENIRSRVLTVENLDSEGRSNETVVATIADFLLSQNSPRQPNRPKGAITLAAYSPERTRNVN